MAAKNRIEPIRAYRAIRALIANPDDTSLVFEVIDAVAGNHGERNFQRMQASPTGARILAEKRDLLATLSDRESLLALPEGSLGRTYAEFMSTEQISADGLVAASESVEGSDASEDRQRMGARLRDMHDLWHVTTGYGRDLLGEASLLAFTYAQTGHRGVGLIALVGWLKSGDAQGARRLIFDAYKRGRAAAWLPAQDWEALLRLPLDEVRRLMRVGPPPRYEAVRSADGEAALAAASA